MLWRIKRAKTSFFNLNFLNLKNFEFQILNFKCDALCVRKIIEKEFFFFLFSFIQFFKKLCNTLIKCIGWTTIQQSEPSWTVLFVRIHFIRTLVHDVPYWFANFFDWNEIWFYHSCTKFIQHSNGLRTDRSIIIF